MYSNIAHIAPAHCPSVYQSTTSFLLIIGRDVTQEFFMDELCAWPNADIMGTYGDVSLGNS